MSFFETFPIFFFFLLAFLFVVLSCTYFILRETTDDDSNTGDAAADAKDLWNGSGDKRQGKKEAALAAKEAGVTGSTQIKRE